jgi:hypothetical protein
MGHPEEYITEGHIMLSFPHPALLKMSHSHKVTGPLSGCSNTLTWPCTVYVLSLTSRPLLALAIACNMRPVNLLQCASKNSFANCVQLEEN